MVHSQFILQPLTANIHRARGDIQDLGDFLACSTFFDEMGYLNLLRGQMKIPGGKFSGKGRKDFLFEESILFFQFFSGGFFFHGSDFPSRFSTKYSEGYSVLSKQFFPFDVLVIFK
jgi:hypothetical protein